MFSDWLEWWTRLLPARIKSFDRWGLWLWLAKERMPFLSRLSLQKRIMLYVAVWLVVISLVYTYVSLQTIDQSTEMVFRERLTIAQTIAGQLDGLLKHLMDELEGIASDVAPAIELGEVEEARPALDRLYQHWTGYHHFSEPYTISLVDGEGRLIWSEPAGPDPRGAPVAQYPDFPKLVRAETPTIIYNPALSALNHPVVSITVPVRRDSRTIAYLIGELDPTTPGSYRLSPNLNVSGAGYTVELVDQNGKVLVSGGADHPGESSIHSPLFTEQFRTRQAEVRIHELPGDDSHGSHIVAYAPLEQIPWGVFVEQQENVALRLPRLLRTQLVLFGLLVLTAGLATAWLATRSAVGPVTQLIAATRRIASGDLDHPVPVRRQDEIGQLAIAFDRMRQDLAAERRRLQDLAILEERDRLAREMHDGFAQALSVLNLNARAARQALMGGDAAQTAWALDALDQVIDQAYTDVREVISSLRTPVPHEKGLIAAVSQYLEEFGLQYGLDTYLAVDGAEDIFFTTSQEIQLLRIIQEALSNVRKHAEADHVQVQFTPLNHEVEITIADDGLGFDPAAVERPGKQAFGLVIMRERVESLKGSFRLETHPRSGTKVIVRIPLEKEGNERGGADAHPIGG